MLFAVHCLDKPNALDVRLANRPAHLDFAKSFLDQILIGGPLLSDDGNGMIGSLFVVDFPDHAACVAKFATDPYAVAGLFQSVTITPYRKVFP